jgi:hypothetical protein
MREYMNNIFEAIWKAKQNDGRVGKDKNKTILDENRNITFYEDYTGDGGQSTKTRSVSVPIDSVEIDSFQATAHEDSTNFIRQVSKDVHKQATKKNP